MKSEGSEALPGGQIDVTANIFSKMDAKTIEGENGKFRLKRQLGVLHGVAIIAGLVAGSGIYISPQAVFRNAGSPGLTLIMWFVGGLYSLCGALVFAEIGLNMPVAGEKYTYLSELYNPYFGFLYIWQYLLLVRPGSNAIKLILFGRFLLKPLFRDCEVPHLAILLIASAATVLITLVNCLSVKLAARSQSLMTTISMSTLTLLAVIGMYLLATGHDENLREPFKGSCTNPGCLVLAFYATVFSYHGWSALNFLVEELKNPKRTLPVAIVLSSVILTVLYVLVNFAYLVALSPDEIFASEAIAISVALKISTIGGWIMSILIAITSCTSFNSGLLVASRLAYAGARKGDLPIALSYINITFITPIASVIFMGICILVYIWILEPEFIVNNITFSAIICDLFLAIGYLKKRLKESKEAKFGKLRIPLAVHVSYCLALFILTVVPLVTDPAAAASACLLIIASATVYYFIVIKMNLANSWTQGISEKISLVIQKILFCAPGDKID